MSLHSDVLLDILRVSAVTVVVFAAIGILQYRETAAGKPLGALALALAAWAGLSVLPSVPVTPSLPGDGAATISILEQVAAATVPPLWLLYVSRYTGRGQRVTRRTLGAVFAPVVFTLSIGLVLSTLSEPLPRVLVGALFVGYSLLVVYGIGLYLVGLYLLARLAQQYRQLPYTQVLALAVALAAPYLFLGVSSVSEPTSAGGTAPILSTDVTFLGFLVSGLLLSYATWRYPLFTALPASEQVARDTVVEELDEAVFIINDADVILDLNAAAAALTARPPGDLLGQPIQTILDGLTQVPEQGTERIDVRTVEGPRQFEVTTSSIPDGDGGLLGRTVLFRDVTERETREQQLEVLTRVLRHNLRNDLDTVLAYVEEIEDPTIRKPLRANAKRLDDTAGKARTIEEVLSLSSQPTTAVDLGDIIRSVADRFRDEHPGCVIAVGAPDELRIRSHSQLLDRLVTELVENAIEHNEQSDPAVEIAVRTETVESGRTRVEIEVADNGPGIPEREREIIRNEQESALKHGSGLGLWLVNWITTSLNGDLSFDAHDSSGSVVTVSLLAMPVQVS